MRNAGQRASPRAALLAILILLTGGVAYAENIDPGSDGSKYSWSENMGWINAQPSGPGGPGVQVSDSGLTGWAWSENAGWISLSCTNRSCTGGSYGVTNNACGTLGGYAWSENAGWINFAPTGAGVLINPKTGIFSGRAWSENAGWITFSSAGPHPYRVTTGWHRLVPAETHIIIASRVGGGSVLLSWTAVSGATSYDVVQGGLSALRSSNGSFQAATLTCTNTPTTSFTTSGNPNAGDGAWFLVRGRNCGGVGTYGSGVIDAGIAASGHDCPP